jgi:hypothetical protein
MLISKTLALNWVQYQFNLDNEIGSISKLVFGCDRIARFNSKESQMTIQCLDVHLVTLAIDSSSSPLQCYSPIIISSSPLQRRSLGSGEGAPPAAAVKEEEGRHRNWGIRGGRRSRASAGAPRLSSKAFPPRGHTRAVVWQSLRPIMLGAPPTFLPRCRIYDTD